MRAFLAVDALIVSAILTDLVDPAQGFVTILALAAVVLLLFRDDVADAVAAATRSSASPSTTSRFARR